MINPFKRRTLLAEQEAAEVRASRPQLDGLGHDEIGRAAEVARQLELANGGATRAARAQAAVDELARRAEQLDQAVTGHADTVTAEAARIAATTKALTASQSNVRAAAQVAEAALTALHDAAQAHDGLVVERAAELRAAGLTDTYADGDVSVEFDTGGTTAKGLVLGGRWWSRVDPTAAMLRSLYVVARGRYGAFAGLAGELRFRTDVQQVVGRTGDLFAPLPDPHVPAANPAYAEIYAAHEAWKASLPQPSERLLAEAEDQRKRDEHQEKQRDFVRARAYRDARELSVHHHGEEAVTATEARVGIVDGVLGG